MTTRVGQAEAMEAAELRLISMGVLSPPNTSRDAESSAVWMKASAETTRTGLPTRLESLSIQPRDPGPN